MNNQEITVLESRLRQINLTCTKGSRFYTIHPNDINKGKAALILFQKIQNIRLDDKLTIGIGDSYNDESLLYFTNKSYLLKNKHNEWSNIKGDNIIKIDGMGQDGWIKVYKEITKSLGVFIMSRQTSPVDICYMYNSHLIKLISTSTFNIKPFY